MTDLRHDFKMTRVMKLDDVHIDILNNLFNTLEEEGRQVLTAQGINEEDMYFVRTLDLRYYGQEHTVNVEVPSGMFNRGLIQEITERFHKAHEKEYTFRLDSPVEVVNLHLAAFAKVSKPRITVLQGDTQDFEEASKGYRRTYLPGVGFTEVPVYEREKLPIGKTKQGPAIIEEKTSTTLVMPGDTFKIDNFGNIVIRYGGID